MAESPAVQPAASFTLISTVGLPRSGKSTWAKSTGLPIVNPDAIRLALHGQRFYGPAEPMVWAIAHLMVEALRLAGHSRVILDATNTQQKRRAEWEAVYPGAVEYHLVPTTPEVCIERARAQADEEIVPVIERMAAGWDYPVKWVTAPAPSAGGETTRAGRCSVCGSARIRHDDGTYGACTLVPGRDGKGGCPAPLRDFDAEQAAAGPTRTDGEGTP